jgi:hypothetical protein
MGVANGDTDNGKHEAHQYEQEVSAFPHRLSGG